MESNLKIDSALVSECGNCYTVARLIGSGGQGEVYEVVSGGKSYALKWYFKNKATAAQKAILERLISYGAPDSVFLWPQELVNDPDNITFGYIMPLLPKCFKGIVDLMKCRVSPTFSTLCKAAFNLTRGYEKLHGMGLSYHDISFGNLFFNPDNGDVLICDTDNVSTGEHISVNGTPRFMAPEIVTGKANPSRNTDLFSLAVLLFYLFMVHHPLEGAIEANIKALDVYAMKKLYGTEPVFIFDPKNDSNRPVRGYHDNALIYWDLYPKQIRDLFTVSFTAGINNPGKRVTERKWMESISNLLFGILPCSCGNEVFLDDDAEQKGTAITCNSCNSVMPSPMRIICEKSRVLLLKDTKLYSHHINGDFDLETPVGSVTQNPANPNLWGIRNESGKDWVYIGVNGSNTPVKPNKSALIARGAKIDFGNQIGVLY